LIDAIAFIRDMVVIERRVLDAARLGIAEVVRVAKRNADETTLYKDRTGRLRGSSQIVDTGAYMKRLIWRALYAAYVAGGTKPHEIRAKYAAALRFVVAGKVIFAKKVKHPGTAKRPFDVNAAMAGQQAASVIFEERVDEAVKYP
jgi:hypothetical protein